MSSTSASTDSKGGDPPAAVSATNTATADATAASSSSNNSASGGGGGAAAGGANLTLEPAEGASQSIVVPRSLLLASEFITAMNASEKVPLPSIKAAVLKKIVMFLEKNAETPCTTIVKPLKSEKLTEVGLPAWAIEWCNQMQDEMFDVIVAANFLVLPALLDVACGQVATTVKAKKNDEEVRALFNIKNDFTPEEEAAVREETKWCEEA